MRFPVVLLAAFFWGLAIIGPVAYAEESEKPIIQWYELSTPGFQVDGFYWFKDEALLRRLRTDLPPAINGNVADLAQCTAGGQLRFQSDTTEVWVDYELGHPPSMSHMAFTGSSGFDLYAGITGEERFVTVGRPSLNQTQNKDRLFPFSDPVPSKMRSFIINFPLYNSIKNIRIGLSENARIIPPEPYENSRPIAVYGTSITQGGCASRPGSMTTNILSRRLRRPFLNFGFSGNGGGEVAVATHLAQIENPALYIFDCEANADVDTTKNVAKCIAEIRKTHPETPILWVSGVQYSFESYDTPREAGGPLRNKYWEAIASEQEEWVRAEREKGDHNIYYLDGGKIWDQRYSDEMTVDGCHPTDYGFFLIAEAWEKAIQEILTTN